jgi:hypothetical protein
VYILHFTFYIAQDIIFIVEERFGKDESIGETETVAAQMCGGLDKLKEAVAAGEWKKTISDGLPFYVRRRLKAGKTNFLGGLDLRATFTVLKRYNALPSRDFIGSNLTGCQ